MAIHLRDYNQAFLVIRELFRGPTFKRHEQAIGSMVLSTFSLGGFTAMGVMASSLFEKFCKRLGQKFSSNPAISFLLSMRCLLSNSVGYSIGHAKNILLMAPDHPVSCFTLGIAVLHKYLQRRTQWKPFHLAQAFAFLFRYLELSGGDTSAEANFNLGRAFHVAGLFHLAIPYYEKVLSLASASAALGMSLHSTSAAYNLAHIYAGNGSVELAQHYLAKYCVI